MDDIFYHPDDYKIFKLIRSSDVKGVKAWIESETTNKNIFNYKGETPLFYALYREKNNIARLFIKNKLYINEVDEECDTPLHWAARNGETEIALFLIKHGAKIYYPNYYASFPIHEAAYYGNWEIVRILIEHGSQINAVDYVCYSPLRYSIDRNNTFEALKVLLDEGAALYNIKKYLKIAHDNNKTLVKYHLKLQVFILIRKKINILSQSAILKFSNTFKLSFCQ